MEIRTSDLVKDYQSVRVVDHVNINVKKGEVVGLLGPNGAGKTTTFYMVIGLVKPLAGSIWLDDEDITKLPMHLRCLKGLGYLPQEPSIFRKLTVEDNIIVLWQTHPKFQGRDLKPQLEEVLDEFDIGPLRKKYGYQLSGGERRRVEIARAMALEPSFLLLDEPFTGIDPIAVDALQEIIKKLKSKGLGVLITDHNVRDTLEITDRAYILHHGKILTSGDSRKIAQDPVAKRFYLGEDFDLPDA